LYPIVNIRYLVVKDLCSIEEDAQDSDRMVRAAAVALAEVIPDQDLLIFREFEFDCFLNRTRTARRETGAKAVCGGVSRPGVVVRPNPARDLVTLRQ
jgi:hypothetical protein